MFDLALKNIMRNRTRTTLTVLGILIGIGAVVALGSIAEGLNLSITQNLQLAAGKITVRNKDAGLFGVGTELTKDDIDAINTVSGILDVAPISVVTGPISGFSGPEYLNIGIEPGKLHYFVGENTKMYQGRSLEEGDSGVAIIGKPLADRFNLQVGDAWTINNEDFQIVGVIEKTDISNIDTSAIIPLNDLQANRNKDTFYAAYVIPDNVKDTEKIAKAIDDASDNLQASTSADTARQAAKIVDQIRFFTIGIGAIAAFVGGLGVMNTMIMAVIERRKEIGVMKAIGATNGMILRQILTESAIMSVMGGIGGILIGVGAAIGLGVISNGSIQGYVTPMLALEGLGFALFLGLIGGFYPARQAAKLDPVEALRYE